MLMLMLMLMRMLMLARTDDTARGWPMWLVPYRMQGDLGDHFSLGVANLSLHKHWAFQRDGWCAVRWVLLAVQRQ